LFGFAGEARRKAIMQPAGMRFFDCNAMIGPTVTPLPGGTLDAGTLLAEMDRLEIERTLFFHYAFDMSEAKKEMNRLTLAAARESPRLIPSWVLETVPTRLGEKLEDQIDRMLEAGIKAARIYPDEGPPAAPLSLKIYLLEKLYDRMNQHRVPLLIPDDCLQSIPTAHSATPQASYDDIHAICQNFPDLPVVILQPTYNSQAQLLLLGQRHRNLHFSIPIYGLFREVENTAKIIGADRMLFGTNVPLFDPSLGMGIILYAALEDRDKALIASGNLERLLESVR
jgi:predicted TIM-barrel fold metal-dependent hydrolase